MSDFVFSLGDFVLKFVFGFFKFAHALAQSACELGEFFSAEEKEDDQKDDHHFWISERSHVFVIG